MEFIIPIIIVVVIAYLIFKSKNNENKNNGQNQGTTINHVTKRGDDASTGFFTALGETTGRASGCATLIIIALVAAALLAFCTFKEIFG